MQLAATMACLNSDLVRLFIEIYGRSTGGGVVELDDKSAGKIPIVNCKKLPDTKVRVLSDLFGKLEAEARIIGETETQDSLERLQPIIDEIDMKIAGILELKPATLDRIKEIVKFFLERRISRIEKASPKSVRGEEEPRIAPPKKMKKRKGIADKQLTRWIQ